MVQLTWHTMGLKLAYQLFMAAMEHSATNMVKLTLHGVDTLTAFSSSNSLCFQLFKGQKIFFSKKDLGGGKNHFSLLFLSFEGFPYTETRVYRETKSLKI